MSALRLSVITCTFRDPEGLRATAASLAAVPASIAWEWLVVDGDADASAPTLAAARAASLPLRHLASPPRGIYAAMNEGAAAATGGAIWFLNGGDRLVDGPLLSRLMARLSEPGGPDVVAAGAHLIRRGVRLYPRLPVAGADWWPNLPGQNELCHQAMLYRRATFAGAGPFATDLRLASDYEHHLRLALRGTPAEFVRQPLVEYDLDGASSDVERAFAEFDRVHERLAADLGPARSAELERLRAAAHRHVRWIKRVRALPGLGAALAPLWRWWRARRA